MRVRRNLRRGDRLRDRGRCRHAPLGGCRATTHSTAAGTRKAFGSPRCPVPRRSGVDCARFTRAATPKALARGRVAEFDGDRTPHRPRSQTGSSRISRGRDTRRQHPCEFAIRPADLSPHSPKKRSRPESARARISQHRRTLILRSMSESGLTTPPIRLNSLLDREEERLLTPL